MRIPNATRGAATGVALCVGAFLGADEGHGFGNLPLTETEWVSASCGLLSAEPPEQVTARPLSGHWARQMPKHGMSPVRPLVRS